MATSEPDVAFPAVLKGSQKQRVPPPVPPRGSPKTKRGGGASQVSLETKGEYHNLHISVNDIPDDDFGYYGHDDFRDPACRIAPSISDHSLKLTKLQASHSFLGYADEGESITQRNNSGKDLIAQSTMMAKFNIDKAVREHLDTGDYDDASFTDSSEDEVIVVHEMVEGSHKYVVDTLDPKSKHLLASLTPVDNVSETHSYSESPKKSLGQKMKSSLMSKISTFKKSPTVQKDLNLAAEEDVNSDTEADESQKQKMKPSLMSKISTFKRAPTVQKDLNRAVEEAVNSDTEDDENQKQNQVLGKNKGHKDEYQKQIQVVEKNKGSRDEYQKQNQVVEKNKGGLMYGLSKKFNFNQSKKEKNREDARTKSKPKIEIKTYTEEHSGDTNRDEVICHKKAKTKIDMFQNKILKVQADDTCSVTSSRDSILSTAEHRDMFKETKKVFEPEPSIPAPTMRKPAHTINKPAHMNKTAITVNRSAPVTYKPVPTMNNPAPTTNKPEMTLNRPVKATINKTSPTVNKPKPSVNKRPNYNKKRRAPDPIQMQTKPGNVHDKIRKFSVTIVPESDLPSYQAPHTQPMKMERPTTPQNQLIRNERAKTPQIHPMKIERPITPQNQPIRNERAKSPQIQPIRNERAKSPQIHQMKIERPITPQNQPIKNARPKSPHNQPIKIEKPKSSGVIKLGDNIIYYDMRKEFEEVV